MLKSNCVVLLSFSSNPEYEKIRKRKKARITFFIIISWSINAAHKRFISNVSSWDNLNIILLKVNRLCIINCWMKNTSSFNPIFSWSFFLFLQYIHLDKGYTDNDSKKIVTISKWQSQHADDEDRTRTQVNHAEISLSLPFSCNALFIPSSCSSSFFCVEYSIAHPLNQAWIRNLSELLHEVSPIWFN